MAPKMREAVGVLSDAVETACGWAFCAVALYALLFVNMTGNGTLWDSLKGVISDSVQVPPPTSGAVQMRVVPVRPGDADEAMAKAQNRMLLIPNEPEREFSVPVLAQVGRAADQITDAPADAGAGTQWKKHLNGSLRTFTVYGEGEQSSAASLPAASASSTGGSSAAPAAHAAPTPTTAASAYHAGSMAEARPGISDHVSQVDGGTADSLRNFR